ncbi:pectinesterase family protein [Acerihabitans sp. TG2]|uniref:pectinesterase family protein n=1 Tax=Acerihabitans sp. TG2 TaxID=3096008 RepID=UPI002B221BF9|nr:pectinesterase family protein [Acerihabitans sp. TG2]MEA9390169.1 pectinesterase family protein [Acerihabitans sp. TG2]
MTFTPSPGRTLLLGLIAFTLSSVADAAQYQAVVSPQAQNNEFATIAAALKSAPADDTPFTLLLKKGVYHERLEINRANVTLKGEARDETIITATTASGMLNPQGKKWGTSGSSTVLVNGKNFTAENLTIRNGFDFPANQALADGAPGKLKDTQAVALLLAENSDRARFKHVKLEGYQDTLYSKTGSRSYFTDCDISGHVDFIFGSGIMVFDHCKIIARNRGDIAPPYGYLTAPSTKITAPYGLIFLHSQLLKEPGVPEKSFALGRPWHPTTTFNDGRYADPDAIGQSVFIDCYMDDHIYGWDRMSGKDKQGAEIWFSPQSSRFFEAHSRGPGAAINPDRPQLTDAQLATFTLPAIFGDWVPN